VLSAALRALSAGGAVAGPAVTVRTPGGASATVALDEEGSVEVGVDAGDPLDEVTLRSYVIGAVHQGLSWVRSEGLAVDEEGVPLDLTLRSFGILPARQMPAVDVELAASERWPVPVGDAVFAATAAAAWLADGLAPDWPTRRQGGRS
jgi:xanthine dehydrogenase small subunit